MAALAILGGNFFRPLGSACAGGQPRLKIQPASGGGGGSSKGMNAKSVNLVTNENENEPAKQLYDPWHKGRSSLFSDGEERCEERRGGGVSGVRCVGGGGTSVRIQRPNERLGCYCRKTAIVCGENAQIQYRADKNRSKIATKPMRVCVSNHNPTSLNEFDT